MKKMLMIIVVVMSTVSAQLFINEIDYDQPGADSGEFFEIAGPANAYSNVSVQLINGNNNSVYETIQIGDLTLSNQSDGYGFHVEYFEGIQNGAPDGIELLINGIIVDAVSYEGDMIDSDGNPMENGGEDYQSEGEDAQSISRIGVDGSPWEEVPITPGGINTNQVLDPDANFPPSANAGLDQTAEPGDVVTLDGSESVDSDGIIESYLWEQSSGPDVDLTYQTDEVATFTFPEVSETTHLVFELTVTDDEGASNTDVVNISYYILNNIPIYDIQENIANYEGELVSITGVVTIGDGLLYPDHTKFYVQDESGRGIQIYNGTPIADIYNRGDYIEVMGTVEVYNDDVEIIYQTITLIDSNYDLPEALVVTGTETTNLNGTWGNATGILTNFWNSDYGFLQLTLTVDGTEVDVMFWNSAVPPGDLLQYEEMIGQELSVFGVITFYNGAVQLVCGYLSDIVDNTDPTLPVANAGSDQTVEPSSTVTLDGSASTDDGSIVFWEWIQLSGTTVTLSDDESEITTFTAPEESGDLVFELTVWDNDWNESSDEVTITVVGLTQISDIQYSEDVGSGDDCYPSSFVGQDVTVSGIVTAVKPGDYPNFFIQDPDKDEWSGVYVYDTTVNPSVGDEVTLTAEVDEYYGVTELKNIASYEVLSSNNSIDTQLLSTGEIGLTCSLDAEVYEGMLVTIQNITVEDINTEFNSWYVNDGTGQQLNSVLISSTVIF